jgi:GxxExxY protein
MLAGKLLLVIGTGGERKMVEIVYPELSYKIVGILYKVYNELGGGYQERIYQAAVRKELLGHKLGFIEQVKVDLFYEGCKLHRYYLDFVVEHKIVLELKVAPRFTPRDIMQVLGYLKQSGLHLGILASLNRNGVFFKRILKGKSSDSSNSRGYGNNSSSQNFV